MTTTREELDAAISGIGPWRFRHDDGAIADVLGVEPLWIAENTWIDGVRYKCAGSDPRTGLRSGPRTRPLSSFLERFTVQDKP